MKFTLKDYQEGAVREVLSNLRKAKRRWQEDRDTHSFSLTAVTGAGKTVMAAAVFEALFRGDDNYDFEADPTAVVLWFSDDPSLNEQTRYRLMEASDRLNHSDMVVVEPPFNRERFQAGKIYFLNTQKLGKKSLLVRGFDADDPLDIRPDSQAYTIWDTIQNTIEDPELTLYLVLDEAHRGMGGTSKSTEAEKSTIVKRLINGQGAIPPIPVVWGISATIDRFRAAMKVAEKRNTLTDVQVDAAKVQESGLLKDVIVLAVPREVGDFDTVLLRRATDKIIESTKAWAAYAKAQGDKKPVKPLLVLQVPNTPDPDDIGRAISTIRDRWPDLTYDAIAHVFGDHSAQTFGSYRVEHISPERVQDATEIRVLIAKDAISTGWDCPRAEVMVSFRPAKDKTHITQLLGRMVRTPLARRIPGNDRLNSVDCLLPKFDQTTVEQVAQALMKGGGDQEEQDIPGRRILINPVDMLPNPSVLEAVWAKFVTLPSQSLPQGGAKPIKRLTLLAHEIAMDKILLNAGKKAHAEMHLVLDAATARYAGDIVAARKDVLTVEGRAMRADMNAKTMSFDDFLEAADYTVIEDAYRRAGRVLSPDVARTYAGYLANKNSSKDPEGDLIDAHTTIAALGLVEAVKEYLDAEADKLARHWFEEFRVQIKSLSDERQEIYRQLKVWSADPQDVDLVKPTSGMQATVARDINGVETPLESYKHHLLCDEKGMFACELNGWESTVLLTEMQRQGFRAWYRNPSRSSQDSLGIAYWIGNEYKIVRPDFLFFSALADGSIVADIVDPHGTFLSDSLPKLRGLAKYAEEHPRVYRRIEAVAKIEGTSRVLDLTDPAVRHAVGEATDIKVLYGSSHASNY